MDSISTIAQLGFDPANGGPRWMRNVERTDDGGLGLASIAISSLGDLVAGYHGKLAALDSDDHLTKAGKTARKAEISKAFEDQIKQRGGPINKLRRTVEKKIASREGKDPFDGDLAFRAAWMAEAWRHLPSDQLEVRIVYQGAIDAGDLKLALAVEAMPSTMPGRPDAATMA